MSPFVLLVLVGWTRDLKPFAIQGTLKICNAAPSQEVLGFLGLTKGGGGGGGGGVAEHYGSLHFKNEFPSVRYLFKSVSDIFSPSVCYFSNFSRHFEGISENQSLSMKVCQDFVPNISVVNINIQFPHEVLPDTLNNYFIVSLNRSSNNTVFYNKTHQNKAVTIFLYSRRTVLKVYSFHISIGLWEPSNPKRSGF